MKTTTVSKRFVALLCCLVVCIALIATALGVNLAERAQAEDAQEDGIELLEEEPSGDIQVIEEETEAVPEDNTGTEAYQAGESAITEDAMAPAEEPASGEPDEAPVPEDSTESENSTEPEESTEPEGLPEESGEPDVAEPAGSEESAEPDLTGTEETGETVDVAEAEPDDTDAIEEEAEFEDVDADNEEADAEDADAENADAEDTDAEEEVTTDEDDYGIMLLADTVDGGTFGADGDNLTWVLDDDDVLTISGTGAMDNWGRSSDVPWYSYRKSITSVIIEDSVTSIGAYAFESCSALTGISIPEGVTSIGDYAFRTCTSLTGISIPEGVTSIGTEVFRSCERLASVELPSKLDSIGDGAFERCASLTGILIPESVTSIGNEAFYGCTALTSISIPYGVTSIGDTAFESCSALTGISIPEGVTSIGTSVFRDCTRLENVELPSTLTSISNYAFRSCSALTSISISEGVTRIGDYAFEYCSALPNISIPEGVTSIGNYAFEDCYSLANVELPSSLTSIGVYAFWYCPLNGDSMVTTTNVKAGAEVYAINSGETSQTTDTTTYTGHTLTIPESVTSVGRSAFEYTSVDYFVIGSSLTSITGNAFASSSLEAIIFDNTWNQVNIDSYTDIARRTDSDEVFLVFGTTCTEITVSKVWDDADNQDGLRPPSIDVQLTADGAEIGTVTLDDSNNWSYTWDGLDVYADGQEIVYEVIELTAPGVYTQSDTGMVKDADGNYSITITNSHQPYTTDHAVTKVWKDADDQDGIRPDSVSVQLLADGVAYGDPVTLDDSNDWTYRWVLPIYAAGSEISYSVEEAAIEGYTPEILDERLGFTIINTHAPETIDINVTKVWDDANNADGGCGRFFGPTKRSVRASFFCRQSSRSE